MLINAFRHTTGFIHHCYVIDVEAAEYFRIVATYSDIQSVYRISLITGGIVKNEKMFNFGTFDIDDFKIRNNIDNVLVALNFEYNKYWREVRRKEKLEKILER